MLKATVDLSKVVGDTPDMTCSVLPEEFKDGTPTAYHEIEEIDREIPVGLSFVQAEAVPDAESEGLYPAAQLTPAAADAEAEETVAKPSQPNAVDTEVYSDDKTVEVETAEG